MNKNDLFIQYLIDVNRIEEAEENRFKRSHNRFIRYIDVILILIITFTLGTITLWNVAKEIAMKLR